MSVLREMPTPSLYHALWVRMGEGPDPLDPEREGWTYSNPHTPAGFEDVIPGGLGTGRFFNHATSTGQLRMALAISPHNATVQEVVMETTGSGTRELMTTLRTEQVLAGMRLVDLGSGDEPGFALAASTMGAEAHTVDAISLDKLDPVTRRLIASHTVVDLSEPDKALAEIQRNTGGELDFVTTNIIGNVPIPGYERQVIPSSTSLKYYGQQLLRRGGYYFDIDARNQPLFQRPVEV